MLAELKGKVDVARTSESSRLEDTLTDAVMSAFRYLPRSALQSLIQTAFPACESSLADAESAQIELWPRFATGTEPDVLVTIGGWLLVIEAKYRSGFGWKPGDDKHQLEREWLDALAYAKARRLRGPLLVAVTDHPAPPDDVTVVRERVAATCLEELDLPAEDCIRWLPWQAVADVLEQHPAHRIGERELVDDVLNLMAARGVRHMFEGFKTPDIWLMAAARHAATTRVYPAITELRHELLGVLAQDGIAWGAGDSGVWMYFSRAADKPTEWPASSVTLPFWPTSWPERIGTQAALVCNFNFEEPVIRVGYVQVATSVSASSTHWGGLADDLADDLASLGERYEVAIDDSYACQSEVRRPEMVDASWLRERFARSRSLWLLQRFSVDEFRTTETARAALLETKQEVESRPRIFQSLELAGLTKPGTG